MPADDVDDDLEAKKYGDVWVWVWTSPGGAYHQGPKRYKRRADALRAGQQWLAQQHRR